MSYSEYAILIKPARICLLFTLYFGRVYTHANEISEFAHIPAGEFIMGDALGDGTVNEGPVRSVYVSGFDVGRFEVTKTLWDEVRNWGLGNGFTDIAAGEAKGNDHPIVSMTWYDILKWCNARSLRDGLTPCYYTDNARTNLYMSGIVDVTRSRVRWEANGYRVPTEAEWEKAARGGLPGMRFPWGMTISYSQACYGGGYNLWDLSAPPSPYVQSSGPFTVPVGSFEPNGYGLYDMAGNVRERCWDLSSINPPAYSGLPLRDPLGIESGTNRIGRDADGGFPSYNCRCSYRFNRTDAATYNSTGFRLVKRGNPMIFIPGIAGSVLEADLIGSLDYQLWPTVFPQDIALLNLRNGSETVRAVDVVRKISISGYESIQDIYGPWIEYMTQTAGYTEFMIEGDRSRLTSGFAQATANLNPKPTLFTFPYDWRRSNADHIDDLQELIWNIRQLHGGAKVNIVTHSMGGLLLRRYMLEYGNDDLNRVVTVACPFWGAPVAVYRMLQGDFFGLPLPDVDIVNNPFIRDSLPTFPSFHELLPSSRYLSVSGSILSEGDQDLDGDRVRGEAFSTEEMRAFVNKAALPDTPFANNLVFHTNEQDDWSGDSGDLEVLHLYGLQPEPDTTVEIVGNVRVVSAIVPSLFSRVPVFEVYRYKEEKGAGDGVVPYVSARRPGSYESPGARYYPVPSTSNDATEHSGMLTELSVHQIIDGFLSTGEVNVPSLPPPSPTASLVGVSGQSRRLEIHGVGFVDLVDGTGNANTRITDLAARQIPGVDAVYGGDSAWVDLEFGTAQVLTIGGESTVSAIEFDYTECDAEGVIVSLHRFHLEPQGRSWTMTINGSAVPELRWDANDDGELTPDEIIPPSYAGTGANLDLVAPTIALELSPLAGGQVSVTLSAADENDPAPTIRYSTNDGPIEDYTSNLVFSSSANATVKAFATDSMGNTSGLVQTEIRPRLTATSGSGTIDIEWSIAEGFILEEAMNLSGPWTQSAVLIQREGTRERASVPTGGAERNFFRLRSRRVEK